MADLTVRRLQIQATATGLDEVTAKLAGIASAQGEVATSANAVALATETFTKKQLSAASGLERLQRQLDDTYRASALLTKATIDLDRARSQGLVTEQRHGELLALATQRYTGTGAANENFRRGLEATTRQTGLARHELVNFSRQMQDVATMAATGQSPFAILSTQAAQVLDIFTTTRASMGSIVAQFAGGIGRFATSGLGLATGAGAAAIWGATAASGYLSEQREVEKALRGVGAASGVTVDGINRLAEAQAAAARVSRSAAREIAAAYSGTGRVNPTQIPGLLDFTKQYGTMQGLGTGDAAKELAASFADPSRGAETLADKLGGLNSAALKWIQSQQAAGDLLGAQRTLLDTFGQQVAGSTERVGVFAQAWDTLKRSVSNADDALGKALTGPTSAERLASLQQQRDRLQQTPGLGVANQLRLLEAQIRPLEAIVELERQRAAIDERTAKAANASRTGSAISDRVDTYATALRELQADATKLAEAMRLNPAAGEYEAWAKSLDRVQGALSTMLPTAERERQAHDLTMRAIAARTLAERTAIEVAREGLRLSGEKVSAAERETAMQRKAAEVTAQATREAQDAVRASRDQLALAGKTPGERARIEADQRYRDNVEKFGSGSSRSRDATLDAIERTESGGRNVPNYKFGPGFTAQGHFQITNSTWRDIASAAGVDLRQYPNAMSAPYDVQRRAAGALYDQRGVQPWAPHNPALRTWLGQNGGNGGAADEIRSNELSARNFNVIDSVVGNSNRELQRQRELLEVTRDSWGKSSEEIAKAAKSQELVNQLQREGVTITPELRTQIDSVAAGYGSLARQTEQLKASRDALREIGDASRDALKGFISDIRSGASGAEAFRNSLNKIADKLIDMAINDLFGKAFGGNSSGGLTSLLGNFFGGFGGGGSIGLTAGSGGLYADGGYTGSGGKWDAAGIVHRGEVVWSQGDVARAGGVHVVEAMRRGMPGYSEGGIAWGNAFAAQVAASRGMAAPAPYGSGRPAVTVNVTNNVAGAEVSTKEREDGSIELIVDQIDGALARKAARGRGALTFGLRQSLSGSNLRG